MTVQECLHSIRGARLLQSHFLRGRLSICPYSWLPACLCRQIQRMCYATRTRTLPLTWYVHAHACGINKFSKPSPSLVNSFFYPIWFWPCMQVYTNTHMRAPISYSSDRTLYLIPSVCTSFLRLDKGNFDNRYYNDSLDRNQDGWICSSRLITL